MKLGRAFIGLAAAALVSSFAFAADSNGTWKVTKDQSPVSFLAVGKPGFLKIRGEGATLEGSANVVGSNLSGAFEVDLTNLKTGIDMRDEHMKEKYLETSKFPKALLSLEPMKIDASSAKLSTKFKGTLTVKGVEKPVEGQLDVEGLGTDEAKGSAEFEVSLKDYPIGVPSHFGVSVAEKVTINVKFVANKEQLKVSSAK